MEGLGGHDRVPAAVAVDVEACPNVGAARARLRLSSFLLRWRLPAGRGDVGPAAR